MTYRLPRYVSQVVLIHDPTPLADGGFRPGLLVNREQANSDLKHGAYPDGIVWRAVHTSIYFRVVDGAMRVMSPADAAPFRGRVRLLSDGKGGCYVRAAAKTRA